MRNVLGDLVESTDKDRNNQERLNDNPAEERGTETEIDHDSEAEGAVDNRRNPEEDIVGDAGDIGKAVSLLQVSIEIEDHGDGYQKTDSRRGEDNVERSHDSIEEAAFLADIEAATRERRDHLPSQDRESTTEDRVEDVQDKEEDNQNREEHEATGDLLLDKFQLDRHRISIELPYGGRYGRRG